jgi:hypothetical protein
MTRGRKKDLSIPPSRSLTQQRDYRARKAQYVTDLEERCHRAEQENAELRKELELARANAGGIFSAEMVPFYSLLPYRSREPSYYSTNSRPKRPQSCYNILEQPRLRLRAFNSSP